MSRPVHFEIPADDLDRAKKFFGNVFGWTYEQYMPDYALASTGDGPGIDGAIMQKKDPRQPITNAIDVKNLDETVAKVEANGGQIVVPKMPVPNMGWVAYFKDTEGNIHGIWQNDSSAG